MKDKLVLIYKHRSQPGRYCPVFLALSGPDHQANILALNYSIEANSNGHRERAGTYLEGYPPENGTKQSVAQSTGQTAESKKKDDGGEARGAG